MNETQIAETRPTDTTEPQDIGGELSLVELEERLEMDAELDRCRCVFIPI
jgi:hypothetical protein